MRKLFLATAVAVLVAAASRDPAPPPTERGIEPTKIMATVSPSADVAESATVTPVILSRHVIVAVESAGIPAMELRRSPASAPLDSSASSIAPLDSTTHSTNSVRLAIRHLRYDASFGEPARTRPPNTNVVPHYRV